MDCKSVKEILEKDVKNIILKQILPDGRVYYHVLISK